MADLLFGSPFRRLIWSSPILHDWSGAVPIPMDWIETPSSHIFKFNVPGFGRDDIKVQLEEGNIIHIRGESPASKEEQRQGKEVLSHLVERVKGDFSRRFELPENVRGDEIKAQVENGVLAIVVPKEPVPAKLKPRTIAVTSKL
ncbi:16.0 kDa heat shock protein, peroxisomal-like [Dioscorea cayenensis subsp. rotundata]|uniref:16.0 kDa heat shock protein, peroxisomal-like n=1 Tax=Dioscorea cayennensis subsp. rotundata TaxID=55577 RepID=A0AB40D4L8_DIOCR|nr:16.0 kDa heat shock protein, peroxisomal-like [Dioscorea cayenensis subsp. rotundata]